MADSAGFKVTPGELHNTAAAYQAQMAAVQQALATFKAKADLPASAFGNLPNSPQMASQFKTFYDQIVSDMTALANSLKAGGHKLAVNATNYQTTEHRNTIR